MSDFFFTIITSNLNSGGDLETTAKSIYKQTFQNVQWLISDGLSSDNSIQRIKDIPLRNTLIRSEKDTGIYNAWNKALRHIDGEWVIFLGAGDTLYSDTTLENVHYWIKNNTSSKDSICYGGVLRVSTPDSHIGIPDEKKWKGVGGPWELGRPSIPCHQGVFHRHNLFSKHPFYDESFRIAADSEIVLRELMAGHGKDMNIRVTKMLTGGISDNKKYRTKLVFEIIKINWKIGIFFKRPTLQIALLCVSWLKYSLLGMKN